MTVMSTWKWEWPWKVGVNRAQRRKKTKVGVSLDRGYELCSVWHLLRNRGHCKKVNCEDCEDP